MIWTVEPFRLEHVEASVAIHRRAFPSFFLTGLGTAFLKEFYTSFLADDAAIGFVAVDGHGRVGGIVVGTTQPAGYFRRLLWRRWWAFAAASLAALLRKPTIAGRLVRAIFYRGSCPPGVPRSLLSSIAVAPELQGQGLGTALVRAFLEEARARGSLGCYLTTDAANNDSTLRFYHRLGWRLESVYRTPEGRAMHRYVLDFFVAKKAG